MSSNKLFATSLSRVKSCRAGATAWTFAGVLWIAGSALGLQLLTVHSLTPGTSGDSPADWPAASSLALAPEGLTLVLFVHPHCPCVPATFAELATIRRETSVSLETTFVFVKPAGVAAGWEQTESWQAARQMQKASPPGHPIHLAVDEAGVEARRFGAQTAGHVAVYAGDGRQLFEGGITSARGHVGPNAGVRAILSLSSQSSIVTTPIYGCPLFTSCDLEKTPCPR